MDNDARTMNGACTMGDTLRGSLIEQVAKFRQVGR